MAGALPEYPDSDFSDDEKSPLDTEFNEAADHVRKITNKLHSSELLEIYGFYKQGTEGKCNTSRPGWLDGKGRKKWDAWNKLGNMPSHVAKQKYIELVKMLDNKWLSSAQERGNKESWAAVSSLCRPPEPDLFLEDLSLMDAARENCAERISELIDENPDARYERDGDGLTALHWAADRGATDALVAAIIGGCPLEFVDQTGQTALHYAASCGHAKATKLLVDAGALLVEDDDGATPLDVAADDEIRNILKNTTR